jgi:hypothetical protein
LKKIRPAYTDPWLLIALADNQGRSTSKGTALQIQQSR